MTSKEDEFVKAFENNNLEYCNDNIDKVIWYDISYRQNLSEKFIEKHSDKLNWYYISFYQKLSKNFISKHFHKLDYYRLLHNGYISPEIKDKLKKLYGFI